MGYSLKSINIDNFRGINEPKQLLFSPKITLLYGNNGKGKTTVLQAIEWVLTGTISNFNSSPFKEEDAFLNIFSGRKECNVGLEILNKENHESITVERIRKLSKNSTPTKTNTRLTLSNSTTFHSEEAQRKLQDILELDPDNYIRNFYIRQDLLRALLEDDPEDASRGLDKLLGTIHIRNLIDAVNIKSKINSTRRSLDTLSQGIRNDKIAIAERIKNNIAQIKKDLLNKGFSEESLTLNTGINMLNNLVTRSKSVFNEFSSKAFTFSKPIIFDDLKKETNRFCTYLDDLDLERQTISSILHNYELINQKLSFYDDIGKDNVRLKKEELIQKLEKIENLKEEMWAWVEKLRTIRSTLTILKNELSNFYGKYQNQQNIKIMIQENQKSLRESEKLLESINLFDSLLTTAIEYIDNTKENNCPLCNNLIEYQVLITILKSKIDPKNNNKIKSYHDKKDLFVRNISEMKGNLSLIEDREKKLQKEQTSLNDLMSEIRNNSDITISNNIDDDLTKLNDKYESYKTNISLIKNQIKDFDSIDSLLSSKVDLEKQLQSLLNSNLYDKLLLNKGRGKTNIQTELNLFDTEGYYYKKIIDIKQQANSLLSDLLMYLDKQYEIKEVMKEINENSEFMAGLTEKKDRLGFFEGSLKNISEAASKYLEEEVYKQIEKHGNLIDEIYNKIDPHPVLRHVSVEIHNTNQILYSISVSDNNNIKTSAVTRFSMSQMNIFAISILTANNIKFCDNFPLLLFDDPSLSMDDYNKERLSRFICEIGKNRQIIIATSDNVFKKYIQNYCKNKLTLIQFNEWSSKGPTIIQ